MKKDDNLEIAILYKKVNTDSDKPGTYFIPYKVIEGYYSDEDGCFYDLDSTAYYHLITNPENIGYIDRINFNKRMKFSNKLYKDIVFKKVFNKIKDRFFYFLDYDENSFGMPMLMYSNNKVLTLYTDDDIRVYYLTYFPSEYETISSSDLVEVGYKDKIEELATSSFDDDEPINLDIKDLYKKITDVVIDQDEPIKKILTAVWKQNNDFSNKSRNILINGGTGVGKTEIFRVLSKIINVPCVITSATEYSATGYKGKDIEDMLISLVNRANGNLEMAEHGILIIDEIDKISEVTEGNAQVNQRSVQEGLLKILEDGVIGIETQYGYFDFDTSKLMVVVMGSWTMAKIDNKEIGFNKQEQHKRNYKTITREEILANGLIPDFVGRFNTIIQMNDLSRESFIKILKQSKNSLLKINKEFLNSKGINLIVDEDIYDEIAKKAEKSKFGARELDTIIENALSKASFQIAINPGIYSDLIINKDTIEDNNNYKLILKKEKNKK